MENDYPLNLDHIAVVARSLEEGCAYIESALGVDMPDGGTHPKMGTHNKLMSLGNEMYLEVISIDPNAPAPNRSRWFDLDRFDDHPKLGTWIVSTKQIEADLAQAHPDSGRAIEMTRGDLNWLISLSDDGVLPLGGAFPTLIEWPAGMHPASRMTDLGCRLVELAIEHPNADEIERFAGHRIDRNMIQIEQGSEMRIRATIQTPRGIRELS